MQRRLPDSILSDDLKFKSCNEMYLVFALFLCYGYGFNARECYLQSWQNFLSLRMKLHQKNSSIQWNRKGRADFLDCKGSLLTTKIENLSNCKSLAISHCPTMKIKFCFWIWRKKSFHTPHMSGICYWSALFCSWYSVLTCTYSQNCERRSKVFSNSLLRGVMFVQSATTYSSDSVFYFNEVAKKNSHTYFQSFAEFKL